MPHISVKLYPGRSEQQKVRLAEQIVKAVATELPNSTTDPDTAEKVRKAYENAIPADSFARAVAFAMSQPEEVDVNEILFRPTSQML